MIAPLMYASPTASIKMTNIFILVASCLIHSIGKAISNSLGSHTCKQRGAGSDRPNEPNSSQGQRRWYPDGLPVSRCHFALQAAALSSYFAYVRRQSIQRRAAVYKQHCSGAAASSGRVSLPSSVAVQEAWGRHPDRRTTSCVAWLGSHVKVTAGDGAFKDTATAGVPRWLDGQWLPTESTVPALLLETHQEQHSKPRHQHLSMLHEGKVSAIVQSRGFFWKGRNLDTEEWKKEKKRNCRFR
jgi:hypothetical protein